LRETVLTKRYARGLIDAATPEEDNALLCRQMQVLSAVSREVGSFVPGLSDERIHLSRRISAAESCADVMKLGPHVRGLLMILVEHRRAQLIPMVASAVCAMISEREGRARADLVVADRSLADKIKTQLEELLSRATDQEVLCDVKVDPGLICGFKVKLGDMRYDASLAGRIDSLEKSLHSKDKEL